MKQVTLSAFFFIVSQGKLSGLCAHTSTIKAQSDHKQDLWCYSLVFYPEVNTCCNLFSESNIPHHIFSEHPENPPSAEQLSLICSSDMEANHSEMVAVTKGGKSPRLAASLEVKG